MDKIRNECDLLHHLQGDVIRTSTSYKGFNR